MGGEIDLEKIADFYSKSLIVMQYLNADGKAHTAEEFRDSYILFYGRKPDTSVLAMIPNLYFDKELTQLPLFDEDYDTHLFRVPPGQYRSDMGLFPSEPE